MSLALTQHLGFATMPYTFGSITSGLEGWWKLDDGSGSSAADSSGNSRTGTLQNSPSWVGGRINGGVDFNGSTQYISVPDNNAFSPVTTGAFTVMAWVYYTGSTGRIVAKTTASTYEFGMTYNNCKYWQSAGADHATVTAAVAPASNTWSHIASTYSNGVAVKFYVNGVEQGSSTSFTGSMTNTTGLVNIGRRPDDTSYYSGPVDDVRIYNRALTASEVMQIASLAG